MAENLLDQLKTMTAIFPDAGDLQAIAQFHPLEAFVDASLITSAVQMPQYEEAIEEILARAREQSGAGATAIEVITLARDLLTVFFGCKILQHSAQRISAEIDMRLAYDTNAILVKSRYLAAAYEAEGISRDRILFCIPATWEGIRAATVLEKESIRCNLILVFGLHQAAISAEAKVTRISLLVGRVLDWYKDEGIRDNFYPDEDPGVYALTCIYNYCKKFGYRTEIIGSSFRNIDEIIELAGCDCLVVSPKLLEELRSTHKEIPRKLSPESAKEAPLEKLYLDRDSFDRFHMDDPMISTKLHEGITGFSRAIEVLEKLLEERLAVSEGETKVKNAAREIFQVYDLDGDGFITREEWAGTDAVFDALDRNGDGRISPEEMAIGLGAAFRLTEDEE
ncbi:MAG: transaldolase [Cyanobacteria bacterium SBLK]|nr:transaldolase [Cyanobacteria bacterium SBLK]